MNPTTFPVSSLRTSVHMIETFCADLSPADMLHRPVPKANCAAWIIGHLVLSARSMAKRLGAAELPPLPEGFEARFSRGENAPEAKEFGDTSGLVGLFKENSEVLAGAIGGMSEAKLLEALPASPNPMFKTFGDIAAFASLHNATHVGHLSTIRRSLGRGPIV